MKPEQTAKGIMKNLVKERPGHYSMNSLRTLQRHIKEWRSAERYSELKLKNIMKNAWKLPVPQS
ncbi:hypothetical protein ACFL35_17020 [Candidatus Riflebacteria bacterium]